jgi:hypothetical protein
MRISEVLAALREQLRVEGDIECTVLSGDARHYPQLGTPEIGTHIITSDGIYDDQDASIFRARVKRFTMELNKLPTGNPVPQWNEGTKSWVPFDVQVMTLERARAEAQRHVDQIERGRRSVVIFIEPGSKTRDFRFYAHMPSYNLR